MLNGSLRGHSFRARHCSQKNRTPSSGLGSDCGGRRKICSLTHPPPPPVAHLLVPKQPSYCKRPSGKLERRMQSQKETNSVNCKGNSWNQFSALLLISYFPVLRAWSKGTWNSYKQRLLWNMSPLHVMQEETDHMSAVNIHTEGQLLAGSVLASGLGPGWFAKLWLAKGDHISLLESLQPRSPLLVKQWSQKILVVRDPGRCLTWRRTQCQVEMGGAWVSFWGRAPQSCLCREKDSGGGGQKRSLLEDQLVWPQEPLCPGSKV